MSKSTSFLEDVVENQAQEEPGENVALGSEGVATQVAGEILSEADPEAQARSLSDGGLLAKVEASFRNLQESLPYLREARDRFAQPGRRLQVDGNPTWTQWVKRHLPVGIRRIQQLLAAPKAKPSKTNKKTGLTKAELSAENRALRGEVDISRVSCGMARTEVTRSRLVAQTQMDSLYTDK
jgi:hypothetical protein